MSYERKILPAMLVSSDLSGEIRSAVEVSPPLPFEIKISDHERLQPAFNLFATKVNEEIVDEFAEFASGKNVPIRSWGHFVISPLLLGEGVVRVGDSDAQLVTDQKAGFALGHTAGGFDDAEWLVYTGFAPATLLENYIFSPDPRVGTRGIYSAASPVVTQLQGFTTRDEVRRQQNQELLREFNWAKVCIYLTELFARSLDAPSIHVLPAEMNIYYPGREQRFRKRYNTTAEKCGFIKDTFDIYTKGLGLGREAQSLKPEVF